MVRKAPELLEATDETIDDAVQFADPMVLRGLVYQLTGDESLAALKVHSVRAGLLEMKVVTESADVALIRAKAASLLKACRDSGPDEIPVGPEARLHRSLELTAGTAIPGPELPMWMEQLSLDPYARGLVWSAQPSPERLAGFSVVVIGAGMGGLNAAVQLSHAGILYVVLEKNSEVGGTWYENRYPGARVDTPSRTYTHIFGANFPYPSPYCEQRENEKYVNWVADHFDIRKNIEFDTEVTSMTWDDSAQVWEIATVQPDGPRLWRANVVITAVGFLSRPNVPKIDGLESFQGPSFHTARWPSELDVSNKRVAVVGTGCTGYQLVPELVKETEHVYLFQRSPNWVFDIPGYLAPYPAQVTWLDRNFPYLTNFVRFRYSWVRRPGASAAANEIDPQFDDPYAVSAANKEVRDQRLAFMRTKFADRPDLMEAMVPDAPPLSARPVYVDREFSIYDVLLRDDVTLVTDGVSRVTEDAIVAHNGTRFPVDIIVLATGFKANDYLWPMEVRGRGGIRLEDLWAQDGARAYLGNMLPGFPNFFMLYGPNTNANIGFAAIHLEELVVRFVLACLDELIIQDKATVNVTEEAYRQYNNELDRAAASKVYLDPRSHSYFKNAHGRCATNGAFDSRLLWYWLRDPGALKPGAARPAIDEELEPTSHIISPYFGQDLILE
jgi:4-hydroxyacetophenone monooxygenase